MCSGQTGSQEVIISASVHSRPCDSCAPPVWGGVLPSQLLLFLLTIDYVSGCFCALGGGEAVRWTVISLSNDWRQLCRVEQPERSIASKLLSCFSHLVLLSKSRFKVIFSYGHACMSMRTWVQVAASRRVPQARRGSCKLLDLELGSSGKASGTLNHLAHCSALGKAALRAPYMV